MTPCDESHFTAVFHQHRVGLYNFLLRLTGDPQDAADLMQDTFIRFFHHDDHIQVESAKTWLFRTGYRLFVDHWRKTKRFRWIPFHSIPEPRSAADDLPESAVITSEWFEDIQNALQRLTPRQRAALLLRERENASYQEIAYTLGCSENNVKSILHRARVKLRNILREKGEL